MVSPRISLALLCIVFTVVMVAAHGPDEADNSTRDVGPGLKQRALWGVAGASFLVALLVIVALFLHRRDHYNKWVLFLGMAVPIVFATIFSAGTTIYLNQVSSTKGPVHWHADFEIWKCGEKIDLVNPRGFSNRVGSPVLHEHADDRIHVEGAVISPGDITLHHFFDEIGGELEGDRILLPTTRGEVTMHNGDLCAGKPAQVQVFVYSVTNPTTYGNWIMKQEKVGDFIDYVLAPYASVPPGNCIIIEFDEEKEKTDKICASYKAAIVRGDINNDSVTAGDNDGR